MHNGGLHNVVQTYQFIDWNDGMQNMKFFDLVIGCFYTWILIF